MFGDLHGLPGHLQHDGENALQAEDVVQGAFLYLPVQMVQEILLVNHNLE